MYLHTYSCSCVAKKEKSKIPLQKITPSKRCFLFDFDIWQFFCKLQVMDVKKNSPGENDRKQRQHSLSILHSNFQRNVFLLLLLSILLQVSLILELGTYLKETKFNDQITSSTSHENGSLCQWSTLYYIITQSNTISYFQQFIKLDAIQVWYILG